MRSMSHFIACAVLFATVHTGVLRADEQPSPPAANAQAPAAADEPHNAEPQPGAVEQNTPSTRSRTEVDQGTLDIPRSSDPGQQAPLRTMLYDQYQMWTWPFRGDSSRKFLKWELPMLALFGGLIASDRATHDALPSSTEQTTWSKRVSQIGAPYSLAGYAGAMYLISRWTGDKRERETAWLSLEALGHSQAITEVLKLATNRERPYKTNGHGGFWKGGNSFPSGHSSGSFAVATIFAYEYHEKKWVPFLAYGLAGVVAASRVSGQQHYISDVTVGSTIGILIGRYIYKHHHDPYTTGEYRRALLTPEVGIRPYIEIGRNQQPLLVPARAFTFSFAF